tara:strand:+ start:44 stop:274 length:231 start_codon:yes stop_codon:yes gene_type:complete
MRFGDLVINENAGDKNPTKTLMYIRGGKMITCLDKSGREVKFNNDSKLKLTKFGRVDFDRWLEKAALTLAKVYKEQ